MMVWLKAWPMCSVPVTLGGGSWMEKFSPRAAASALGAPVPRKPARPSPIASHCGPQRDSMAAGSNDLERRARPGCWDWFGVAVMAKRFERSVLEKQGGGKSAGF